MAEFAPAIRQLEAVRESADDPRAAYLIRSRLKRALLTCARTVAETQALEKPRLPGQWVLAEDAPEELTRVVELCRRIHQNSEHLCQPSESFDIRWEDGWRSLSFDLDRLQEMLVAVETTDQAPERAR